MNIISRGARNAFRNITRTASIVAILGISIGLALAMLVAREAASTKIEAIKSSVGNTVSIQPAGARGFEGGGEPLTVTQAEKLSALDHVSSSIKTLSDRLTTDTSSLESAIDAGSLGERNAARSGVGFQQPPAGIMPSMENSADESSRVTRTFTPPVTLIGTNDPQYSMSSDGETGELTEGKIFPTDSDRHVALIGKSLAEKNNLSVGDTFTAHGTSIEVVGIYDTGTDFGNNQVIMPLITVQNLSDQVDQFTSITIKVDSMDNVSSVSEAASKTLGDSVDITDSRNQVALTIEPLKNIQTISMYSLIGAVLAGAAIILLTMVMIVRERRREIGVLKAIGGSNLVIMGQFIVESVTLTLLGTIVGITLGVAAASPITETLVSNSTTSQTQMNSRRIGGPDGPGSFGDGASRALSQSVQNIQTNVGWEVLSYSILIALIIAVLGSALTSIFISKVRPAEVMRAE